jgi:hypothetical protein
MVSVEGNESTRWEAKGYSLRTVITRERLRVEGFTRESKLPTPFFHVLTSAQNTRAT